MAARSPRARFATVVICADSVLYPLAGRSPSYLVRQLYDMQRGNRNGAWAPLMASVVAHLGTEDMLTAAAYLASLKP
jgi:cytochrome c553